MLCQRRVKLLASHETHHFSRSREEPLYFVRMVSSDMGQGAGGWWQVEGGGGVFTQECAGEKLVGLLDVGFDCTVRSSIG